MDCTYTVTIAQDKNNSWKDKIVFKDCTEAEVISLLHLARSGMTITIDSNMEEV